MSIQTDWHFESFIQPLLSLNTWNQILDLPGESLHEKNVPSFRSLRILQNELGYCFWHSAGQQGALLELYILMVLAMPVCPLIFDRSQGVILILLHKGLYYPDGEEVNKTVAML